MLYSIQYKNGWLDASKIFHTFTQSQSIKFYYTFHYHVLRAQMFEKWCSQIDSKNECLLLLASFTAKFGLAFVLTLENAFSQRFHFKASRKSIGSSKKWY